MECSKLGDVHFSFNVEHIGENHDHNNIIIFSNQNKYLISIDFGIRINSN